MAQGIILAGGFSSRMESNKMVLPFEGKALICQAIETMQDFVSKIIVVTGFYHDDLVQVVLPYEKVVVIRNLGFEEGMFSSVLCGVRQTTDDFFVVPGDYPLIQKSTYDALVRSKGSIRVPIYQNKKGHPIYMEKELKAKLLEEPKDSNLKNFRNAQEVTYVEVQDEGILLDVDTITDYQQIHKNLRKER